MLEDHETAHPSSLGPVYEAYIQARKWYRDGIVLASALISRDRAFLLAFYPLLVAPACLASLHPALDTGEILILSGVERLLYASFFFILLHRWFAILSAQPRHVSVWAFGIVLAVNGAVWAVMMLPTAAELYGLPEQVDYGGGILLIPLAIIGVRYFFYFMPVMLGYRNPRAILRAADEYTRHHRFLPVKLMIPPLALSAMYSGIVTGFSPDLRHTWVTLLLDVGDGVFWVLSCYLSLGVGLAILAKNRLPITDLDPYLDARLDTMKLKAPGWITGLLNPAHSMRLIIVSALIWVGNMVRLWELTPAPEIRLSSVTLHGNNTVAVELHLRDSKYRFRGFRPIMFRIAGESGEPITGSPTSATTAEGRSDILYYYPRTSDESTLTLNFLLVNRAEDFTKLQDLHLWYAHARIAHIDPAKIIR